MSSWMGTISVIIGILALLDFGSIGEPAAENKEKEETRKLEEEL